MSYNLLGVGNDAKTIKGNGDEYLTAIKYMKPYKTVWQGKVHNLCALADKAKCHEPCLFGAGRGQMSSVIRGRERKTLFYLSDRVGFMDALINDITIFRRRCIKNGVQPCVRLNGTSDIMYEKTGIMDQFPDVQFYDYTKIVSRAYKPLPENYHLTLSYSEADSEYAAEVLQAVHDTGVNAAVVFRERLPETFKGLPVFNADKDDLRFLDPTHSIAGLVAKGAKAKRDRSGFVIDC